MKRKKSKKLPKILFLLIIIFIIFGIVISNQDKSLEDLGYNKIEIEQINKLTDGEIKDIKLFKYNSHLVDMITSENYNPNNLYLYLKYTEKYKDIKYLTIFNLINSKDFKEENIQEYTIYLKENNDVDAIIKLVNEYGSEYSDERTINLMKEKYYIHDYLDRYLKYIDKNPTLDYKDVITNVNSNLDKEFYVDVNEADASKGMFTLVNKFNYLKEDYVPDNLITIDSKHAKSSAKLNKDAYKAFIKMYDDMKKEDMTIKVTTAYRDYNFQKTLYNNYVKIDGKEQADTYSARPGYSEHQLGYSVDLTTEDNVLFGEFKDTEEYKWLVKNAYKYGFILRYPKDKEYITGYVYESWHFRYLGIDVAKYIYENDITYEEYYAYFLR